MEEIKRLIAEMLDVDVLINNVVSDDFIQRQNDCENLNKELDLSHTTGNNTITN